MTLPITCERLTLAAAILVAGLGVAYLAVANDTATRGYALGNARVKLERVRSDRARLEMELAAAKNWEQLSGKFAELGLRVRGGVSYADVAPGHALTTALFRQTAVR